MNKKHLIFFWKSGQTFGKHFQNRCWLGMVLTHAKSHRPKTETTFGKTSQWRLQPRLVQTQRTWHAWRNGRTETCVALHGHSSFVQKTRAPDTGRVICRQEKKYSISSDFIDSLISPALEDEFSVESWLLHCWADFGDFFILFKEKEIKMSTHDQSNDFVLANLHNSKNAKLDVVHLYKCKLPDGFFEGKKWKLRRRDSLNPDKIELLLCSFSLTSDSRTWNESYRSLRGVALCPLSTVPAKGDLFFFQPKLCTGPEVDELLSQETCRQRLNGRRDLWLQTGTGSHARANRVHCPRAWSIPPSRAVFSTKPSIRYHGPSQEMMY